MGGASCRGAGGKLRLSAAAPHQLLRQHRVGGAGRVELCWSFIQRWRVNLSVHSHFSLFTPEIRQAGKRDFIWQIGKRIFFFSYFKPAQEEGDFMD